jgi:hypothetical protein
MSRQTEQLLGLVGNAASGKDLVASLFFRRGYLHISASDIVREKIHALGQVPTRAIQSLVADEFRQTNGGDYFVKEAISRLSKTEIEGPKLISGIYSPAEGSYICDQPNGDLVYIRTDNTSEGIRSLYDRLIKRSDGSRDQMSFDEFLDSRTRENSGNENGTNVARLHEMSRFIIVNMPDTTVAELDYQVSEITEQLGVTE